MTTISKDHRAIWVAVAAVVTFFATRALFGDVVAGFVDGMFVGFTDAR